MANPVQTLTPSATPTGGTATLSFNGATTAAISWNDTAATIQSALEALATIGRGNVNVVGSFNAGPVVVTFVGLFANTIVPALTNNSSLTNPGAVTITVATPTAGGPSGANAYAANVVTYQDAIDRTIDYLQGRATAGGTREIRRSILDAYEELVQAKHWRYYLRATRLHFNAPYGTGTVAYTNASRQLTLSGGTWPLWAASGIVQVSTVNYYVDTRDSDTQLTLQTEMSPDADIAAGAAYNLFQSIYTLPVDFRKMSTPRDEQRGFFCQFRDPEAWLALSRYAPGSSGSPSIWTVMGDPRVIGQQAVHFFPYPDSDRTEDFIYLRQANPLALTGFGANERGKSGAGGTISVTGRTVTGAGTSFFANMVGGILRGSRDSSNVPEGKGGLYPYAWQRMVTGYSSTTGLTIDSPIPFAVSGVAFSVSSPLDIDPMMLQAFWSCLKKHVSLDLGLPNAATASERYEQDYAQCSATDSKSMTGRSAYEPRGVVSNRLARWPRGADS